MFVPYRVIQIKKNHQKRGSSSSQNENRTICNVDFKTQNKSRKSDIQKRKIANVLKKTQIIDQQMSNFNKKQTRYQQQNPQNLRYSLNIPKHNKMQQKLFRSINLQKNSPQKTPKYRPYTCLETQRSLSRRYKSHSQEKKIKKQEIIKPKKSLSINHQRNFSPECQGWKYVHNVYENQGKQFYFNFSRNIENLQMHYNDKNRSISANQRYNYNAKQKMKKSQKTKNKKSNLFEVYINQIKYRRSQQQNKESQKLIVEDNNQELNQIERAKMRHLQHVYQQWKGHFDKKKQKRDSKSIPKKSKTVNKVENYVEGDIDRWQMNFESRDRIQEVQCGQESPLFF